jgi:CRP-like cAMP-binding protein
MDSPSAYRSYYLCRLAELQSVQLKSPQKGRRSPLLRSTSNASVRQEVLQQLPADPRRPHSSASTRRLRPAFIENHSSRVNSKSSSNIHLERVPSKASNPNSPQLAGADLSGTAVTATPQSVQAPAAKIESPRSNEAGGEEDEEEEEASAEDQARAAELLKRSKFFSDLDQELLAEIPKVSRFTEEVQGAVVFRQNDPPGNCYLIVKGQVGFFIGKKDPEDPSPRQEVTEGMENERLPFSWDNEARVLTIEGFSTFCGNTDLGKCVHRARAGAVFGELALMHDNAIRKASAKCLIPCEFLVVPASAFKKVKQKLLQMEMEKREFLYDQVPGMSSLPPHKPSDGALPTFFFDRVNIPEHKVLLRQGFVEKKTLFMIFKGTMQISHRKTSNISYIKALEDDEVVETVGPGTLIGNLPHDSPEIFTVTTISPCQVFQVLGSSFGSLPRALLDSMRQHVSCTTSKRMRQNCITLPFGWESQQQPKESKEGRLMLDADSMRHKALVQTVRNRDLTCEILSQQFGAMRTTSGMRWRT